MNGDDLTKDQAGALATALFPSINYLLRMKKRMYGAGFPPDDPLLVLTENAYDAVQRLYLDLLTRSAFGSTRPGIPTTTAAPRTGDVKE